VAQKELGGDGGEGVAPAQRRSVSQSCAEGKKPPEKKTIVRDACQKKKTATNPGRGFLNTEKILYYEGDGRLQIRRAPENQGRRQGIGGRIT